MSATASNGRSKSMNSASLSEAFEGLNADSMVLNMKSSLAPRPTLIKGQSTSSVPSSASSSPGSIRDIITPVSYWDSFRGIDSSSHTWSAPLSYQPSNGDNTMDIGLYSPK